MEMGRAEREREREMVRVFFFPIGCARGSADFCSPALAFCGHLHQVHSRVNVSERGGEEISREEPVRCTRERVSVL